jgi:hypothetical protein
MSDDDAGPVLQRLVFGEKARELRIAARVELAEADAALGKYRGKLSKIENGMLAPAAREVETMIGLYGVAEPDAEELRQMGADARKRASPERVAGTSRQYVSLERAATDIHMVYAEIPGILQTADYAQAQLARSPVVAAGEVEGLATARAERAHRVTSPDGPRIRAVIGEEALYRAVGGTNVLRAQLDRLRQMSSLPHIELRLISFSAGACAALSCPFTLLYLRNGRRMVYVESLTRPDMIKSTGPYAAAFDLAWQTAETDQASQAILDRRINELS